MEHLLEGPRLWEARPYDRTHCLAAILARAGVCRPSHGQKVAFPLLVRSRPCTRMSAATRSVPIAVIASLSHQRVQLRGKSTIRGALFLRYVSDLSPESASIIGQPGSSPASQRCTASASAISIALRSAILARTSAR